MAEPSNLQMLEHPCQYQHGIVQTTIVSTRNCANSHETRANNTSSCSSIRPGKVVRWVLYQWIEFPAHMHTSPGSAGASGRAAVRSKRHSVTTLPATVSSSSSARAVAARKWENAPDLSKQESNSAGTTSVRTCAHISAPGISWIQYFAGKQQENSHNDVCVHMQPLSVRTGVRGIQVLSTRGSCPPTPPRVSCLTAPVFDTPVVLSTPNASS